MTPADLSDVINLGILILAIFGLSWCVNSILCPADPHEHAYADAQKALHRANRDVNERMRLKQFKE